MTIVKFSRLSRHTVYMDWKCAVTRWLHLFAVVLAVSLAVSAEARETGRASAVPERLIARCIHASARGKPWLEKTLWGLRDQEGGWIGAEVRNNDGTYDLGPMQINSRWVPRMSHMVARSPGQVRRWLREDPCFNVEAARWLLLTGLAASSDYWTAIGTYHSPRTTLRNHYIANVARRLRQRYSRGATQTSRWQQDDSTSCQSTYAKRLRLASRRSG